MVHPDSVVMKAQQRLFNLRKLKKFGLSPKTPTTLYRCSIESILYRAVPVCITALHKALQRVGDCTALCDIS